MAPTTWLARHNTAETYTDDHAYRETTYHLGCCHVPPVVEDPSNLWVVGTERFLQDVCSSQVQGVRLVVFQLNYESGNDRRVATTGNRCQLHFYSGAVGV